LDLTSAVSATDVGFRSDYLTLKGILRRHRAPRTSRKWRAVEATANAARCFRLQSKYRRANILTTAVQMGTAFHCIVADDHQIIST
jgi:hypothetical protein